MRTPFITVAGSSMPLRRSNVDTDQIIPARFLQSIKRTGFEEGLFARWREDPDFVLNDERYANAKVLVAGRDFGTGSSREHAVWALQQWGFEVIVSSRFGDIFRNNATNAGLATAVIGDPEIDVLQTLIENAPATELTVDLESRTISAQDPAGTPLRIDFEISDSARGSLLRGEDAIARTLTDESLIAKFESTRPRFKPTTGTPARVELA